MKIESLEHWVLLVLDLSIWIVTLYDTMRGSEEHNKEVDKYCEAILMFLLYVIDSLGVFHGFDEKRRGIHLFAFKRIDNNPQQNNGLVFFFYW